jgi:hypothetical protein
MVSGDGVQPLLQPGTARLPRDALGRVVQRVNLVAVAHWIQKRCEACGQMTISLADEQLDRAPSPVGLLAKGRPRV